MTACLSFTIGSAGALILIPNPMDLGHILKTIEKEQVTIMLGIPTMYAALGSHKNVSQYNLESIRACISGGAPLIQTVKDRFEAVTGSKLVEGYGLSEASPVTHANPINGLNKPEHIGIPLPDTECKIVSVEKEVQEVVTDKEGELVVRGPQIMKGYWQHPEATDKVLRDGWLYTGDIVRMDEDGYFQVVDRKKDIIIVKGFNVYPAEVEKTICTHPKVANAAVIGIPHEYKGEEIKAYVILKKGQGGESLRSSNISEAGSQHLRSLHPSNLRNRCLKTLWGNCYVGCCLTVRWKNVEGCKNVRGDSQKHTN